MYDLEIIVPAETELKQRFIDFKKWGLLNIGDYKIKLILAASFDNKTEILESGWPPGIDVEVVVTPYKHVAQRIYYYYSTVIKPDTANWYMRVDEDSMNDISNIMKNLNDHFDPDRDYQITAEVNWDIQSVEKRVLKSIGFSSWFNDNITTEYGPPHDYEISITSRNAMKRILQNEKAQQYFKLRQTYAEGYGDHGLCLCARMEKIHPIETRFLTIRPDLAKFSMFDGPFAHIHWVGRDKNPCVIWLDLMDLSKNHLFVNQSFLYYSKKEKTKKWVKFKANNTIDEIFIHNQESRSLGLWTVTTDNKLSIYLDGDMNRNSPLPIFDVSNEPNEIVLYSSENHELRTGPLSSLLSL